MAITSGSDTRSAPKWLAFHVQPQPQVLPVPSWAQEENCFFDPWSSSINGRQVPQILHKALVNRLVSLFRQPTLHGSQDLWKFCGFKVLNCLWKGLWECQQKQLLPEPCWPRKTLICRHEPIGSPHCKKMDILLTVTAQSGWQFPVSQSNHINQVFVSKPGENNSSKEMTEDVVIMR